MQVKFISLVSQIHNLHKLIRREEHGWGLEELGTMTLKSGSHSRRTGGRKEEWEAGEAEKNKQTTQD